MLLKVYINIEYSCIQTCYSDENLIQTISLTSQARNRQPYTTLFTSLDGSVLQPFFVLNCVNEAKIFL